MTALRTHRVAADPIGLRVRPSSPRRSAAASAEQDRVVVVEHQRVVADDIAQAFAAAGAEVAGVASCARTAHALIADMGPLAGAVLDLDLDGGTVLPVADELARQGVPFLFTTGHDACAIPDRFAQVTLCEKPFDVDRLVLLLLGQIRAHRVRQGQPWASRRHAPRATAAEPHA